MPAPAAPKHDRDHHAGRTTPGLAASFLLAFEGAMEAVPFVFVAGLIAFEPLGEALAGTGIAAAFLSVILVGLLVATVSDPRGMIAGPSAGLCLMMAAAIGALAAHPPAGGDPAGLAIGVGIVLTCGVGLVLAGCWLLGVGHLAPHVPYPVLAGLRNGTAVLLIWEQAHAILGLHEHLPAPPPIGAILVAGLTVLAMLIPLPGLRRVPRVLLALLLGTALDQLLRHLPAAEALAGPVMASATHVPFRPPVFSASLAALARLPPAAFLDILLPTLISMAVLAVLETVASASAQQSETGRRTNGARDLLAIALANLLGGALGALPASGSLEETVPEAELAVRRSRLTALLRCVILLAIGALSLSLLPWLPRSVPAGLIIAAGLKVADLNALREMTHTLRGKRTIRTEAIGNLLIVLAVAAVVVVFGLVVAVIIGVLLSLALFVVDMARGPIRRRYHSPLGRSRVRRGERDSEILLREGAAIEVIELQGALFFGSTDQVIARIEAALQSPRRYLVLDLRRVHRIDLSAARSLLGSCERLWARNRSLALAGMRRGLPAYDYLFDRGLHHRLPHEHAFASLEDAIEWAETRLLADHLGTPSEPALTPLAALAALGIPHAAAAALLPRLNAVDFDAGALIARAGDTTRAMFVLLEGRVDVRLRIADHDGVAGHGARIASLAAGTIFGEMALLSNAPRSADLLAHGKVRCLRLDPDGLERLRAETPDAAWHLLKAIAQQIELNLRLANAAIASYEE